MNDSYYKSVKRVYETLSVNELLEEYFSEFGTTKETKKVIEELFEKSNTTLEQAYWKHRELIEKELLFVEDKTKFPRIKVIGTQWFYKDWIDAIELRKKMGSNTADIETIDKFYEIRSKSKALEQQAEMDKIEDEIGAIIHYGKLK